MVPAGFWNWREPFLLPLVLLVVTRAWFAYLLPLANEDAYITFRYAWNLQAGNGLVYNPGERVFGFTSPLWTVWSALGIWLVHDPVLWSRAWSLFADAVTLVALASLLRRHVGRASAWCFAVFFAGWIYFAALTVSGMEMSALLALMSVSAVLIERGSPAAGPVLGALALTRPEGLIAALVMAPFAKWRERLVALAIAAAGCAALWSYFGTLVPHGMLAKAKIYGTPGPWMGRIWWEWVSPVPIGSWGNTSEGEIVSRLSVVLGPAAVVGASRLLRERTHGIAAFALAAGVVWLGYSLLGVTFFFWYLAVPLVAAGVLASVGMPRIVRGPAVYAGAALFVLGAWLVVPPLYVARAQGEAISFYRTAGRLARVAHAGEKIMLEPIGIIGYTCPLVVVDEVGLVTPGVTERRLGAPGWLADIARSTQPKWLLMRRSEMTDSLSFAGAGQPFRSSAERDELLAHFRLAEGQDDDPRPETMVLLERVR